MNKYSPFFAAYNHSLTRGNTLTKEEQVQQFTRGRTQSLKDLTDAELAELTRALRILLLPPPPQNKKEDSMRKAIIAIFKSMGRQTADAIQWAEKQGAKGVKKKFNDYSTGELFILITIAEKIKADFTKSIRQKIQL